MICDPPSGQPKLCGRRDVPGGTGCRYDGGSHGRDGEGSRGDVDAQYKL